MCKYTKLLTAYLRSLRKQKVFIYQIQLNIYVTFNSMIKKKNSTHI